MPRAGALLWLLGGLLGAGPSLGQPLLDGEALPAGLEARRLEARVDRERPWAGQGSLRLTPDKAAERPAISLPLPEGLDPSRARALAAHLRARNAGPLELRWTFADGRGRPLFVRPVKWEGGPSWTRVEWPLAHFRWGDQPGRWQEVRRLTLVLEEAPDALWIDDLELVPAGPGQGPWLAPEELEDLAGGRGRVSARLGPVWVSTPGALPADARERFQRRAEAVDAWLRGLAPAGGAPPLDPPHPVPLLVFRDAPARARFLERLAVTWGARIVGGELPGLTLQDVATALASPAGLDRPVNLHEVVHALAARALRVRSGDGPADWLQEGLAYYVQLALFPTSLGEPSFAAAFARDPGPGGWTPLGELFSAERGLPAGFDTQVASLVAFLALERPEWLRGLCAGLGAGQPTAAILTGLGTDPAGVQAAWLAWGRARYPAGSPTAPLPPLPGWEALVQR